MSFFFCVRTFLFFCLSTIFARIFQKFCPSLLKILPEYWAIKKFWGHSVPLPSGGGTKKILGGLTILGVGPGGQIWRRGGRRAPETAALGGRGIVDPYKSLPQGPAAPPGRNLQKHRGFGAPAPLSGALVRPGGRIWRSGGRRAAAAGMKRARKTRARRSARKPPALPVVLSLGKSGSSRATAQRAARPK